MRGDATREGEKGRRPQGRMRSARLHGRDGVEGTEEKATEGHGRAWKDTEGARLHGRDGVEDG